MGIVGDAAVRSDSAACKAVYADRWSGMLRRCTAAGRHGAGHLWETPEEAARRIVRAVLDLPSGTDVATAWRGNEITHVWVGGHAVAAPAAWDRLRAVLPLADGPAPYSELVSLAEMGAPEERGEPGHEPPTEGGAA